jgi:hypothetical protein
VIRKRHLNITSYAYSSHHRNRACSHPEIISSYKYI